MPRDHRIYLRLSDDEERLVRERAEQLAVKPATYLRTVATAPIEIFLSELDEYDAQGVDDPKIDLRTMRTETRPTHRLKDTCVLVSAWDLGRISSQLTRLEISADRCANAIENVASQGAYDYESSSNAASECLSTLREIQDEVIDIREHVKELNRCSLLRLK